uniref:Golgi associated, gamma adaptin ear containing, ARF binding protein 3b n=1 Tax=Neogobius melanostomus TaxID=47308 RepID=A0A8C6WSG3_9GOBI
MAYQEGESLESWLNKATHPTNRQEDWEYIIGFCDQINRELEGPQIAVTLLVHKIHSPQEWEALQALTVLEACMKNCGRRFHNEVGKYRFLNELIKIVSPKYMGDSAPEKVKTKIVEMLYSWTIAFPDESKIAEAYQTLKRQGLVPCDPELPLDRTLIPSSPTRPKHPVFDNEDMGKVRNLIKGPSGSQQDEVRVQKVTKRMHTLEEVSINVKLLTEMLSHYNKDSSSDSDKEIIKELYERCDKLRRAAFKMATESEDNDTNLGDILQASDDLSRVINSYKKIVEGLPINGDSEDPHSKACHCGSGEITFPVSNEMLKTSSFPSWYFETLLVKYLGKCIILYFNQLPILSSPSHPLRDKASASLFLLDDELLSLGIIKGPMLSRSSFGMPVAAAHGSPSSASFFKSTMPGSPALSQAQVQSLSSAPGSPQFFPMSPGHPSLQGSPARGPDMSLSNVYVPLESIMPSKELPVTAYDKDGVRVLFNFASNCPPGRSDVLVMVVSMLNTAPLLVHSVVLQAAVPKSMKVKLQPPSGTELAPFNPILPPASITQIMLLANPSRDKVRLRYKLAFTLGDRQCNEVGEVDQFPPPDTWGHL